MCVYVATQPCTCLTVGYKQTRPVCRAHDTLKRWRQYTYTSLVCKQTHRVSPNREPKSYFVGKRGVLCGSNNLTHSTNKIMQNPQH